MPYVCTINALRPIYAQSIPYALYMPNALQCPMHYLCHMSYLCPILYVHPISLSIHYLCPLQTGAHQPPIFPSLNSTLQPWDDIFRLKRDDHNSQYPNLNQPQAYQTNPPATQ
jgi:hypothetical protein